MGEMSEHNPPEGIDYSYDYVPGQQSRFFGKLPLIEVSESQVWA